MRLRSCLSKAPLACAITFAIGACPAKSENLCDGLKQALAAAEASFVPLRGDFDFSLGEYRAKVTFGGASDCSTDNSNGVAELQCTQEFQDLSEAQAAFTDYMGKIRNCFGQGITLKHSNLPYHQWFRHEETTDDIEIRVGSYKQRRSKNAPTSYIQIKVSYIDPTAK